MIVDSILIVFELGSAPISLSDFSLRARHSFGFPRECGQANNEITVHPFDIDSLRIRWVVWLKGSASLLLSAVGRLYRVMHEERRD